MKCTQCNQEIKLNQKFCPSCGILNIHFKENIIDSTINTIKESHDKIINEISTSENLNKSYNYTKTQFNIVNDKLVNIFFFVGIFSLFYGLIFESGFFKNPILYTEPNYEDIIAHFFYFLGISLPFIILPILFFYLKIFKESRMKNFVILFIGIYLFSLFGYYENYIEDGRWKEGNPMHEQNSR